MNDKSTRRRPGNKGGIKRLSTEEAIRFALKNNAHALEYLKDK